MAESTDTNQRQTAQTQKRRSTGKPAKPATVKHPAKRIRQGNDKTELKFVRYADDFSVYCKRASHARSVARTLIKFLKTKLNLTINEEKSDIRKPVNFNLLGFGFAPTYQKGKKNQYQLIVSAKAWKTLKQRLKRITRKTSPIPLRERISKVLEIQRGWLNYFRGTSIQGKLKAIDGWLRNRLRYCIWHHWKKPERKRKNLIRLGVDQDHAYAWSRSRKGGWAIAQSPILGTTITEQRLKKRGYQSLLDMFKILNPSVCEPPYTRPLRTLV